MIREIIASLVVGMSVAGAGNPTVDEVRSPTAVSSALVARQRARQPRPNRAPSEEDMRIALDRTLGPGERVEQIARAVGCTLVLTDRRLLLVRDGANYRPTSGVRAWPLDGDLELRVGAAHRETKRVTIAHAADTASVFLSGDQLVDARQLLDEVRRRTFVGDESG